MSNNPNQATIPSIPTQIAITFTGAIGGQDTVVSLNDIEQFACGAEEFKLAIPPTGVSIGMQTVLDFLATELKFQESSLPDNVLKMIRGTKVILYDFRYRRPSSEKDSNGKWIPKKDSKGNPDPGDFMVSVEVRFDADGHGDLLSDLIGVDISSILAIKSVKFTMSQGIFPEDMKAVPQTQSTPTGTNTAQTAASTPSTSAS